MSNTTEPLDASVTLEEIFAVVTRKRAALTPELAGYLVLELAEGAADAGEVDARVVYVSEEGSVALVRGPGDSTGDAEVSLRGLLGRLLEAAGAQTPSLGAVARRRSGAGVAVLVEELEASLIPVNRAAGKRALARLARETKRVISRVGRNASAPSIDEASARRPASLASVDVEVDPIPPEPATAKRPDPFATSGGPRPMETPTVGLSKEELDAATAKAKRDSVDSLLDSFEVSGAREDKALSRELKAMAGLDPTLTPPPAKERPLPAPAPENDDAIESLLAASAPPAEVRAAPPRPTTSRPQLGDRALPTSPTVRRSQVSLSTETRKLRRKSGSGLGVVVLVALVIGGFAIALWLVKPGFLTGRTPEKIAAERAAAEAERARIAAKNAQPACHASLVVTGAPRDAEILVREGQAPVDVEHMPVGARLEFVATAEGYAPRRTVLPADATWGSSASGPRFELPVQLDKSRARSGSVDRWPPGEPGTDVGEAPPKGAPGTVHVVSSPKGAEVWLVAGIGQDSASDPVTMDNIVPCDKDVDLLVAGPTTYRKRLHVPASGFVADPSGKPGQRVAHVVVK